MAEAENRTVVDETQPFGAPVGHDAGGEADL